MAVSDRPGVWFHCGHCGALFKAPAGAEQRGSCPACSHDPVTGEEAGNVPVKVRRKVRKQGGSHHHQHENHPHHASRQETRQARKKARYLMYFVFGWIVLLAVLVVTMKQIFPNKARVPSPEYVAKDGQLTEEDIHLLQVNLENASNHFQDFLTATDVGSRALHVLRPEQTVPRMGRYYDLNPQMPLQGGGRQILQNVMHTPAGPAIETLWRQNNGELMEAVFFEEKGEWKLDWDAYVRYGTGSWGVFLANTGEGEGSFRVLARERIGANGRSDEYISLVLYEQRAGHPEEAVSPSPEIRVTRATALGRAIQEAFDAKTKKLGAYQGKVSAGDPRGMIRLNLKIRRSGASEREFHIEELLAAHWLELQGTPVKAEDP